MLIITRLINQLTMRGSLITPHGEMGTGGNTASIFRYLANIPVMMMLL